MSSLSLNTQPPAPGTAVQDFHHQEPSPRQHQHIFSTPVSPTSEATSRFSRAGGILGFKTGPSRKAAQVSSPPPPPLPPPAPPVERSVGGVKRTTLQQRSGSAASTETVTLQDSSEMAPTSAPVRVHQYGPPSAHHTAATPASNAIHGNTARSSTSYVLADILSSSH